MVDVEGGILVVDETLHPEAASHRYGTRNEYQLSFFYSLFLSLLMLCLLMGHYVTHHWKLRYLSGAGAVLCVGIAAGSISLLHSDSITDSVRLPPPPISPFHSLSS
jgi:hypothetical protein